MPTHRAAATMLQLLFGIVGLVIAVSCCWLVLVAWRLRQTRRAFVALTDGVTLEFRLGDAIGMDDTHLYLAGFRRVDEDGRPTDAQPPSRHRLEDLQRIEQRQWGDLPFLVLTIARSGGDPPMRIGRVLFHAADAGTAAAVIAGQVEARMESLIEAAFTGLTAEARLAFVWRSRFGFDADWLYTVGFRTWGASGQAGCTVPPTRHRLDALRDVHSASEGGQAFLILALSDRSGAVDCIALACQDLDSAAAVEDALRRSGLVRQVP